jgi:8-oxo-dGTP pyrophosphatase MutT (NUDIX family)
LGFPRGGVDDGEDYIETAKREVLEETGIEDLKYIQELGVYERYPNGITKDTFGAYPMEIHMFLFRTECSGELVPKDMDVKEVGWFSYEDALERLENEDYRGFFIGVLPCKVQLLY